MAERGMLIVLSGPSGVGKGTVLGRLLREDLSGRYCFSVSATTRSPRPGEEDGRDYHFIAREEFLRLVEEGQMLEHAEYGGNLYGTLKQAVERERAAGRHVVLDIEVQGADKVRARCPEAVFVFVLPPSVETLHHRLKLRGTETPEALAVRLAAARRELARAGDYDYVLINSDLDRCVRELETVLAAAALSPRHRPEVAEVPDQSAE